MRATEARKGLRVCLSVAAYRRHEDSMHWHPRTVGALTSGRIKYSHPPYEEGLMVRVKWDAMPTPEYWHLADLRPFVPVSARPPESGQGGT